MQIIWSILLHLNLVPSISYEVWTPGQILSHEIPGDIKSFVESLNGMRWSTSFKSFSQMMMMNG